MSLTNPTKSDNIYYMITSEDMKRLETIDTKKHRLDNLAKACADAKSDDMKSMWYMKLKKLAKEYNMMDYFGRLIH